MKGIYDKTIGQDMFEKALKCGFLSNDKTAKNYIGDYMFMGIVNNEAGFKHYNLRNYIKISVNLLNEL